MDSPSMLSRSGKSDQAGKLTQRIDVPMSEEMYEAIVAMSVVNNPPINKAELIRQILAREIWGVLGSMRRLNSGTNQGSSDEYHTGAAG